MMFDFLLMAYGLLLFGLVWWARSHSRRSKLAKRLIKTGVDKKAAHTAVRKLSGKDAKRHLDQTTIIASAAFGFGEAYNLDADFVAGGLEHWSMSVSKLKDTDGDGVPDAQQSAADSDGGSDSGGGFFGGGGGGDGGGG